MTLPSFLILYFKYLQFTFIVLCSSIYLCFFWDISKCFGNFAFMRSGIQILVGETEAMLRGMIIFSCPCGEAFFFLLLDECLMMNFFRLTNENKFSLCLVLEAVDLALETWLVSFSLERNFCFKVS